MLAAFVLAIITGCSWHDSAGTKHTLILGIGMISSTNPVGIVASDTKIIGISFDRSRITAGISQQHLVTIDPEHAQDAVISLTSTPFTLSLTNWNPNSNVNTNKPITPSEI